MKKAELKELYQMMFPEYPDIVTVAQLQKILGISRHVAYDLLTDREFCAIKIGGAYKIPRVSVINYVMSGEPRKEAS